MLASIVVDVDSDSSVAGMTTLRQAIEQANTNDESDTISFDSALEGKTITLDQGTALVITESVEIDGMDANGNPLNITIDASGNDPTPTQDNGDGTRVFDIRLDAGNDVTQQVTLNGLTPVGMQHRKS